MSKIIAPQPTQQSDAAAQGDVLREKAEWFLEIDKKRTQGVWRSFWSAGNKVFDIMACPFGIGERDIITCVDELSKQENKANADFIAASSYAGGIIQELLKALNSTPTPQCEHTWEGGSERYDHCSKCGITTEPDINSESLQGELGYKIGDKITKEIYDLINGEPNA